MTLVSRNSIHFQTAPIVSKKRRKINKTERKQSRKPETTTEFIFLLPRPALWSALRSAAMCMCWWRKVSVYGNRVTWVTADWMTDITFSLKWIDFGVLVCVWVFACLTYMKFVAQTIPGFNRIRFLQMDLKMKRKGEKMAWEIVRCITPRCSILCSTSVCLCARDIIDAKSFTLLLIKKIRWKCDIE